MPIVKDVDYRLPCGTRSEVNSKLQNYRSAIVTDEPDKPVCYHDGTAVRDLLRKDFAFPVLGLDDGAVDQRRSRNRDGFTDHDSVGRAYE